MSARDAYITIHNNTGYPLVNLSTPDPTDGVFTSKPSSTIGVGSSSKFEVSKSNDASVSGPEGYLTYQFTSQGQTYTVRLDWNFPNNSATSAAYWITGDNRVQSVSSTVNHDVGEHTQNIDAYVEFTSTAMNNWDVVLAMTEPTLNNQLLFLYQKGCLNKSINATTSSGVLEIDSLRSAPSVQIAQTANTVTLTMPVRTGSVTPHNGVSTDLGGCSIAASVKISSLTLSSVNQVVMTDDTASQVEHYFGLGLSVMALFLDLQQASPSGLSITNKQGTAITDSAVLQTVAAGLAAWGSSSVDSRWGLNFVGSSTHPTSAQSSLPGMVPTSSSFSTTWCASTSSSPSTLNLLMMLNGNAASGKSLTSFAPLITDKDVWILQKIDANAFTKNYIRASVLPSIQQALKAQKASWSAGSNSYWNISYIQDNSSQNGGKGTKTVEDNEADYYTLNTARVNCDVNLLSSPGLSLKVYTWANLESKTTKYPLFGASWLPILVSDTTDMPSETAYFDFTANSSGQLTLVLQGEPTRSKGTAVSTTGSVQSAIDWMKDALDIDNNSASFESANQNISNVWTVASVANAVSAVAALDNVLLLPEGNVYTYQDIRRDNNSDITLSLTPRT